jgi:GNAT superfamily N-acetyltransferase
MIPAKELSRIVARRGARWWDRAIRRGTAVLVLEVGGAICGYATVGPNRARNLPQKGEVYEIYLKPEYQGVGLGTRLFWPPAANSPASASTASWSGRWPTTTPPAAST